MSHEMLKRYALEEAMPNSLLRPTLSARSGSQLLTLSARALAAILRGCEMIIFTSGAARVGSGGCARKRKHGTLLDFPQPVSP